MALHIGDFTKSIEVSGQPDPITLDHSANAAVLSRRRARVMPHQVGVSLPHSTPSHLCVACINAAKPKETGIFMSELAAALFPVPHLLTRPSQSHPEGEI